MFTSQTQDPFAAKQEHHTVLSSLASTMSVDLIVNERGNLWVLHDKQLPAIINWVEFDAEMDSLTLVSQTGQLIDLGMKIPKMFQRIILQTKYIYIVYMADKAVKDIYILPVLVRDAY